MSANCSSHSSPVSIPTINILRGSTRIVNYLKHGRLGGRVGFCQISQKCALQPLKGKEGTVGRVELKDDGVSVLGVRWVIPANSVGNPTTILLSRRYFYTSACNSIEVVV